MRENSDSENDQMAYVQHVGIQWQTNTTRRPVSFYQDAPALLRGPSGKQDERKSRNCERYKNHSPRSLCAHNHTNVANFEQLRLATFSQPTFFCRRPSLPRQRAGKLQLTHLFSHSHTDKQTTVEPALALLVGFKLSTILRKTCTSILSFQHFI